MALLASYALELLSGNEFAWLGMNGRCGTDPLPFASGCGNCVGVWAADAASWKMVAIAGEPLPLCLEGGTLLLGDGP